MGKHLNTSPIGKTFWFYHCPFWAFVCHFWQTMDGWMNGWMNTNQYITFFTVSKFCPQYLGCIFRLFTFGSLASMKIGSKVILISCVDILGWGQIYQLLPDLSTCLLVRLISLILTPCVLIGLKGSSCHPGSKVAWPVTSFISLPTEGVDKMQSHRVSYIWKHDSWHGGIDSMIFTYPNNRCTNWCERLHPGSYIWPVNSCTNWSGIFMAKSYLTWWS